jgi:transposase
MLCLILIVGGLLIMMGQHDRSEALFYYFRLEDHVPETHLLRLIEKHISFAFVRARLKQSYSETGRPSIDPELLLRILLIGYLYGITSERKLVEELRMHLAWRWFTGLGFDQEIPHHSTFSKNRHGRFQESKLFEQLFEQIVRQCVEVGLVQGQHLSVDGSFIEANAAKESRIPREQLAEAAQFIAPCGSICGKWKSRIRWKSRCMNRTRFLPPIPPRPMPPRAARRRGWDITTTIWWTITVV